MVHLVRERVPPANDVAGWPPEVHEGVLGLRDEYALEPAATCDLELVQALDVEDDGAARAVDLEGVLVDPPRGETGRFEGAGNAVLELDRGGEAVVHLVALDKRADDGTHRRRLADQVAAEVDDVGAEVAECS